MGYRVDYGPVKKVRGTEKRVCRGASVIGVFLLLVFLLAGSLWPEGKAILRRLIFPGDPAVTAAALENLTEDLRSGEDLTDSMSAFCIQILEGAELDTDR